jgi:type IV secretion system protein VirB1
MLDCPDLSVPREVMQHVVHVESSRNPFAIGVVGGYLARQPKSLEEALAAVKVLKEEGYNFSVGIAQVNRYNLAKYGLNTYAEAFEACPNLQAGSRILRECYDRAQDWGKAFSCYYSGNFATGFDHGYVQKIFASMRKAQHSVSGQTEPVRIIPYNNNPRKPAKEDNVPLQRAHGSAVPAAAPAPAASAVLASRPVLSAAVQEAPYPEPYAIRRYLPSTPLSALAAAMAPAPSAAAVETAESRPAIPVPGPGALPPEGNRPSAGGGLAHIPTQVVGVNGNPYQTRVIPPSAAATAGVPGDKLPLPDLNAPLARDGGTAGRKPTESGATNAMAARKGGSLVHTTESSGKPENTTTPTNSGRASSAEGKAPSGDQSFVF